MAHTTHYDVLIIGAGLSGIGTACHIRKEHPQRSLAIIERRTRLGGTWDLFRYPGIRSDSDMASFGFRFKPWTSDKVLADGPSIRQYITETAQEDGLDERIHYGLQITAANWCSAEQQWQLTATEEASGTQRHYRCNFLLNCTGYYNYDAGYRPQFAGEADFAGRIVHPQHWPQDLDYAGKRVVVIGSGATAMTLVPAMADKAARVTMLQRSPTYVLSLPNRDAMAVALGRVLPASWAYRIIRARNIAFQRGLYLACRRWPQLMRRFLLSRTRKALGPDADMRHFTPKYMPWDQRLCAVPDGDLFNALREGRARMCTDEIERFTAEGIRLRSGATLPADIIVTATGLDVQMLGGLELSVDGRKTPLREQMIYRSILVQDVPNFAWIFGYTNAPWTLKSDIAGRYVCRLPRHMDARGLAAATPRDRENAGSSDGILDSLQAGYVQRARHRLPRQGRKAPWAVEMHYGRDKRALLKGAVDDGVMEFTARREAVPGDAALAAAGEAA